MPTECNPTLFEFAPVEGRAGGGGVRWWSDHLGCRGAAAGRDGPGDPADGRFAACFTDARDAGADRA